MVFHSNQPLYQQQRIIEQLVEQLRIERSNTAVLMKSIEKERMMMKIQLIAV